MCQSKEFELLRYWHNWFYYIKLRACVKNKFKKKKQQDKLVHKLINYMSVCTLHASYTKLKDCEVWFSQPSWDTRTRKHVYVHNCCLKALTLVIALDWSNKIEEGTGERENVSKERETFLLTKMLPQFGTKIMNKVTTKGLTINFCVLVYLF